MYRGEGDESELASLSAPVVMSLSKTSLIFNGAQLQGKREKRRAHNLHARTHTHHIDICRQHITDSYTLAQSAQSLHAQIENTHALWYSDANRVLWELMELRHRGLETGNCTLLGEEWREREGVREEKRSEEKLGSIGIDMRICGEVRREGGRRGKTILRWACLNSVWSSWDGGIRRKKLRGAMIVEKKLLYDKLEGKPREIATHHRLKLYFLVSPPTYLSLTMSHPVVFSLSPSQVLDILVYILL